MRCDKGHDWREDKTRSGRMDSSDPAPIVTPAGIPSEIAIILSSVEDGLNRLRKPKPDLDGVRDLLRVIALAAGAATERAAWPVGRTRLDLARFNVLAAGPAPGRDEPLARRGVLHTPPVAMGVQEVAKGGLARWQQKRVVGLMARLDQDAPTVSELAAVCRLSSGYFIKAFKQTFGATPRRWRQMRRIEQAKRLLESNDRSIAEIAFACGFSDQSHLTRVFGQIVGVPPARWRRRCVDTGDGDGSRAPADL